MKGLFAQENKVVLALPPVADAFATAKQTDVISADNCESIVFIVATGVAVDNVNIITVQSCDNFTPSNGTDIVFTVSSVISGDTNDSPADTATTGKAFTASTANQYYIVEVDPADVEAAASHAGRGYVALTVTEAGSATAQVGCIIAFKKNVFNAQAVLPTAIA